MKKPKIKLDKEAMQKFLLNHIEKVLLVIVVGLMLLVIWRGFSLPELPQELSPQALVSLSNSTKSGIDNPETWNQVKDKRQVDMGLVQKVLDVRKNSDPLAYMFVNSWMRPDFPKLSPREDPTLFAPINLVVRPVVGPLASYPKPTEFENYKDPLYPQLSDDELKAQKKKAAQKAKKAAAELAAGGGGEYGGEGMPGAGRGRGKRGRGGEETPSAGMPGMSGEGGYGGMMGMGGTPSDRYPESMMHGFAVQNAEYTIARNVASVTLMAVVPIQQQTEEFEKKLSNSMDYSPQRDLPYYFDYRVQRADVTDLDPSAPIDDKLWLPQPAPATVLGEVFGDATRNVAGLYAGVPPEVSDPLYLSDKLTMPAPPYLKRDLWDLLSHPDVPVASLNQGMVAGELAGGTAPAAAAKPADDDAPTQPMFGGPGMPGAAGMPGGSGLSGEGGYSSGGGYGGMRPGGMMGGGGMMPGGGGMMPGGGGMMPGGGGMMPGMMGGGGYGSSGESGYGGYGSGMQMYTPPKYNLVRYTDLRVEPGRKYRYRIRVYLYDPNHPPLGVVAPSGASLDKSVRDRLRDIDEADGKRPKDATTGMPYRTYWIITPWSEPSPIAEVPRSEQVYAGKVTPPSAPTKIKGVDVVISEPRGEALAVVFDHAKIADVPAEAERVSRGSVLNFVVDKPKVIHPVTKEIVELPAKYDINTYTMVADLMGGESFRQVDTSAKALNAIGEMLVVDADGRMKVRSEDQDIDYYRRFTLPKLDPKAKAAAEAAAAAGGEYSPTPTRGGRRGAAVCF